MLLSFFGIDFLDDKHIKHHGHPRQVRGTAVMGSVSAMVNRRATPARLMTPEEARLALAE